jgi:hypothetical protein
MKATFRSSAGLPCCERAADQAALHGVIDRIGSLGLELAEIQTIAGAPDEPLER